MSFLGMRCLYLKSLHSRFPSHMLMPLGRPRRILMSWQRHASTTTGTSTRTVSDSWSGFTRLTILQQRPKVISGWTEDRPKFRPLHVLTAFGRSRRPPCPKVFGKRPNSSGIKRNPNKKLPVGWGTTTTSPPTIKISTTSFETQEGSVYPTWNQLCLVFRLRKVTPPRLAQW